MTSPLSRADKQVSLLSFTCTGTFLRDNSHAIKFIIFKVYNSVIFSIFTAVQPSLSDFRTFSSSPEETSSPMAVTPLPPSFLPSARQPRTYFLSLGIHQLWAVPVNGVIVWPSVSSFFHLMFARVCMATSTHPHNAGRAPWHPDFTRSDRVTELWPLECEQK